MLWAEALLVELPTETPDNTNNRNIRMADTRTKETVEVRLIVVITIVIMKVISTSIIVVTKREVALG